jgi:hypothetical protein
VKYVLSLRRTHVSLEYKRFKDQQIGIEKEQSLKEIEEDIKRLKPPKV